MFQPTVSDNDLFVYYILINRKEGEISFLVLRGNTWYRGRAWPETRPILEDKKKEIFPEYTILFNRENDNSTPLCTSQYLLLSALMLI